MCKKIESNDEVDDIEEDYVIQLAADPIPHDAPSRGLNCISQQKLDMNQPYFCLATAGENVMAYVIDSGVYVEHHNFNGRAKLGTSFVPGCNIR